MNSKIKEVKDQADLQSVKLITQVTSLQNQLSLFEKFSQKNQSIMSMECEEIIDYLPETCADAGFAFDLFCQAFTKASLAPFVPELFPELACGDAGKLKERVEEIKSEL